MNDAMLETLLRIENLLHVIVNKMDEISLDLNDISKFGPSFDNNRVESKSGKGS